MNKSTSKEFANKTKQEATEVIVLKIRDLNTPSITTKKMTNADRFITSRI